MMTPDYIATVSPASALVTSPRVTCHVSRVSNHREEEQKLGEVTHCLQHAACSTL